MINILIEEQYYHCVRKKIKIKKLSASLAWARTSLSEGDPDSWSNTLDAGMLTTFLSLYRDSQNGETPHFASPRTPSSAARLDVAVIMQQRAARSNTWNSQEIAAPRCNQFNDLLRLVPGCKPSYCLVSRNKTTSSSRINGLNY